MKQLILLFLIVFFNSKLVIGQHKAELISRIGLEFYYKFNSNDYLSASIKGDSLIDILEEINIPMDSIAALARIHVGESFYNIGNYQKALEIDLKSQELFSKKWTKSNSHFLLLLNRIAWDYKVIGEYSKAINYFKEIKELNILIYGKTHIFTAATLNNLGVINNEIGNYNDAILELSEALEIYKILFGENDDETLRCFSNLALCYRRIGQYEKSLKLNESVLLKRNKYLGENHPSSLLSLNNLAEVQEFLGLYELAQINFSKCISIQDQQYGKDNNEYLLYLSNYASLMLKIGKVDSSLRLNQICLNLSRKINGPNHPSYINRLNNFGVVLIDVNKFSLAKIYFDSALVLSEMFFGNQHEITIQCYENLASAYGKLGDYSKAIDIEIICLNLITNKWGDKSLVYANGLNSLALFDSKVGLHNYALKWNKEAYNIYKELLGINHPSTLLSAYNLSVDLTNLGRYKEALDLLKENLKIKIKIYGANSIEAKLVYNNIGLLYYDLKDYDNSLKFLLKALDDNKNYTDKAAILLNVSSVYEKKANYQKAIEFQEKAVYNYLEDYLENQLYLSENQKIIYKQKLDYYVNYLTNLNLEDGFQDKNYLWYNYYISSKNLINNQSFYQLTSKSSIDKVELLKISEQIKFYKAQKNKFIELNNESKLKEIQIDIDKLEIKYSSAIGNSLKKPLDFKIIQNSLKTNNDVFIDIVPVYNSNRNRFLYVAVYISKNEIELIQIDSNINLELDLFLEYREQTSFFDKKTDLKSENFYNYFWKPIADKIGNSKTIYVSLGGVYNNINLNTLYNTETGKYLLEEKDIHIVNSARDFVLKKEKNFTTNTASLFGFPNFDGNITISSDISNLFTSTRDLNSFWLDSLSRGGMTAKPLPATKVEIENISSTLKSKGWKVTSFLADNASETNIKKQQSPRILHVSTHGYFFEHISMGKDDNRFLGMGRQQVVHDPMLRSGLLLTGANKTLKGETTSGENGLLSAAEAALLDLRETELVVLSACETGKGEVKNSEGVYGLRKAFSDAGAQNIIMSLWKVDDKVTQEFMTRFYEIWLNDKTSIREAFHKTQFEIKAKYPQPYYWGAFILVGE